MKSLFKHLKPYLGLFLLASILILTSTMADLALPGIMKEIVNRGIGKGNTDFVISQGVKMLLITLVNLICWVLASYFGAKAAFRFARDLRKNAFSHVINSSVDQVDKFGVASLITRTTNDITAIEMASFRMLRMGTVAPFTCIGGIILTFRNGAEISVVFVFTILLLAVLFFLVIRKATPLFTATFPKTDVVNRVIRENLTGIRVIRAFNKDKVEKKRFDVANEDLTHTNMKAMRIIAWQSPLITLFMNLTILAILYIGAQKIDGGSFLPGELIALIQYAVLILGSFRRLSIFFQMLPRTRAAANRVSDLLNLENVLKEPADVGNRKLSGKGISFSHVTFSYGSSEEPVLDDVSFTAEGGKTTAIVGGTGAGKSTLMQLILRFYDVNNGCVTVGGVDVRDMKKDCLRSMMGYASQKTELFAGSVTDNLSFGSDNSDSTKIQEAAQIAQADAFICTLSEAYGAKLSQNGKNFSGGQRQRLSIARALARNTDILLFDDSFSALDFKTDSQLRQSLKVKKAGSTILIIAQRIATIMDADRIVVLNNGKVEDTGKHDELMNRCAFYKELALSQISLEEAKR
jgi:ATP-binding cassette subfamily B protein